MLRKVKGYTIAAILKQSKKHSSTELDEFLWRVNYVPFHLSEMENFLVSKFYMS
jgi:hypothetical protein